jgi:hypothetical protein
MASEIPTSMLNFTLNYNSLRLNFKLNLARALVICELIVNNDSIKRTGCVFAHTDIFT